MPRASAWNTVGSDAAAGVAPIGESVLFRVAIASLLLIAAPASAEPSVRPSLADSFRLGKGGDTLCQVQRGADDPAAPGLFDRSYALTCRDASAPVGRLYALNDERGTAPARLDTQRRALRDCADGAKVTLAEAGAVATRHCRTAGDVGYDILTVRHGRTLYVAEGLSGYRSALELGLRTLVADRIVDGPITIALTGAGDAASFARVQAGSLDPALALGEGYRRNNAGNYAEASEFFAALVQRSEGQPGGGDPSERADYLLNRALQQSNLGNYDEADALFAQAAATPSTNPVTSRQQRNYRALDLLNHGKLDDALAVLTAPAAALPPPAGGATIDRDTAVGLNRSVPLAAELGIGNGMELTPAEKAALLDAQAVALEGTVLRLQHHPKAAADALDHAMASIGAIREGRVASVARLRAEVMTDQAGLAEEGGRLADAEALLRQATMVTGGEYPDSLALDASRARLAAFLARHGKDDEAATLYRAVVVSLGAAGGAAGGFANLLDPYFALLVKRLPAQPALGADLFVASQVLLRPGVADTQATLARELSGGNGEAARLFRESLNQTRRANVLRVELARLAALDQPTSSDRAGLTRDRAELTEVEQEQSTTQARLAGFPAYRAIATQAIGLADLRAALKPGEAYWKLTIVGESIYGMLVSDAGLQAWRVGLTPRQLGTRVDAIRATIAQVQDGAPVTAPFDATAARALYVDLAGPAADALPKAKHLIFEPDGAMLRLPITLLIDRQGGLDRYLARQHVPHADAFDMTGIDWLGGDLPVSVALSPRAFRDVRGTPSSAARATYLAFGQNAPISPFLQLTGYAPTSAVVDCRWPPSAWSHPISAAELYAARDVIGAGDAQVVTGAAFTDSDILGRHDLARYRIVHFATHGLVVAPRAECSAQPALLTSFGASGSDGLLTFSEIYGLRFDADLIVLSACDTAGSADVAATRAAGIETGGGNALDGLVRAFIGAGARAVLASHWPAPDDFHATEHLVEGLFTAPRGMPAAEALRQSERRLMDVAATSHPYYWAGFALIGDGARPVLAARR